MNALTTFNTTNATLTMSSREIAKLTGKRHDHVMVDIRNMLNSLGLHAPEFSGTYKNERGNTYECFNLPKDLTITLVSGYNVQMRYAITKRWMELEEQQAQQQMPAIPKTYAAALRLAAELEEQKEALLLENEELSQIVNFVTVREFATRKGRYLSQGQSQRMARIATSYCAVNGLQTEMRPASGVNKIGFSPEVKAYPIEAVEHAWELLDL